MIRDDRPPSKDGASAAEQVTTTGERGFGSLGFGRSNKWTTRARRCNTNSGLSKHDILRCSVSSIGRNGRRVFSVFLQSSWAEEFYAIELLPAVIVCDRSSSGSALNTSSFRNALMLRSASTQIASSPARKNGQP